MNSIILNIVLTFKAFRVSSLAFYSHHSLRQTPLGENDNFLLKNSIDVINISEWLDIKLYLKYYTRSNTTYNDFHQYEP